MYAKQRRKKRIDKYLVIPRLEKWLTSFNSQGFYTWKKEKTTALAQSAIMRAAFDKRVRKGAKFTRDYNRCVSRNNCFS